MWWMFSSVLFFQVLNAKPLSAECWSWGLAILGSANGSAKCWISAQLQQPALLSSVFSTWKNSAELNSAKQLSRLSIHDQHIQHFDSHTCTFSISANVAELQKKTQEWVLIQRYSQDFSSHWTNVNPTSLKGSHQHSAKIAHTQPVHKGLG